MTSKPHDALFKAAFENPVHAAAWLRQVLPAALVREIDWDTLTLESSSFMDPSLESRHGDLLFSARIRDMRLYLYTVVEHQSQNLRKMCLRALGYIVRKWEREKKSDPLPLAVAVVVSHAPEGWTSPVHMHELLSPAPSSLEGVAELVPGFRILVDDLAHLSNEQLKSRALAAFPKLALWALRDSRHAGRLLSNLAQWVHEVSEALRAPSGIEAVAHVLRYVAYVCQDLEYEQFSKAIREQLPEAEVVAMTMAEELIQKGRAEGRAEGRVEGRVEGHAELLVKLLIHKFGDVPPEYLAAIETASPEQLDRYAMRVVTVETLASVFTAD